MAKPLHNSLDIMALMLVATTQLTAGEPPTRNEREDIDKKLKKEEAEAKAKKAQVERNDAFLTNLDKSIEALEKTLAPLVKETEGKPKDDPAYVEVEKMVVAAKALKEARKKENDAARKDANLLQIEVNKILKEYFAKADPKMVAERYGVDFDGIDFNGTSEFLKRTSGNAGAQLRYGLGAEHTWDDRVGGDPWYGGGVLMKAISQHEQVTTRDMYDTAKQLLEKKIPGVKPLIGRVGMTHNITDLEARPEAYKHIFGNKSFPPSVLNNSTRWYNDIEKPEVFRKLMDLYTRGEGTQTIRTGGTEITYGLPTIGRPILMNSGGNGGWNDRPNFTIQKNFYPNRLNIGSIAKNPLKDADRCDPAVPVALEDYCSANYTDALIRRPCWQSDGSRVQTQYVNPKYRDIISDNLWRLAGEANGKKYKGTPTEPELADELMYPPALVKAVKADIEMYCKSVAANEGVSPDGFTRNLRGTSFAAPVAAGVMYAAGTLYPDASEAELISAFLASCEPVYHRLPEKDAKPVDDLMYQTDPKTGWCFSPRGGGYGEFVMRDDATEKKPDSWMRMQAMLEQMRAERMKMTRNGKVETTVEVGEGPDKRKVVINGQPAPVTIEFKKIKAEPPSEAMKKADKKLHNAVIKAFELSDMHACTSVMGSEIMELVEKKDYKKAVEKYKESYVASGFVSESDPFYEGIQKAVKDAEEGRRYTYSVSVPEGHDICCTFASLRLKYADNARTDRFIVLESPDGRKVPLTMSEPHSGIEVGSTSGFMGEPGRGRGKGGTWKIHTLSELDLKSSSLELSGTERNPDLGIVDVRETVLAKAVEKEAAVRTKVPANNRLVLTDPHEFLREWSGLDAKKKKIRLTPATYEDQREYMQELLEKSELRKGGFIPKDTRIIRPGETPEKKDFLETIGDMFKLFMSPKVKPKGEGHSSLNGVNDNWGALAAAIAATDEAPIKPAMQEPPPFPMALVSEQRLPDSLRDILKPLSPEAAEMATAASASPFADMEAGTWVRPSQIPAKPAALAGEMKRHKTALS